MEKSKINELIQWAIEIVKNGLTLIDDHSGSPCKVDHLVLVETTDEGVFLCPVVDGAICCPLNRVLRDEDGGYHWSLLNVGGNVWNRDPRKNISDRCADYNAVPLNSDVKIVGVIC